MLTLAPDNFGWQPQIGDPTFGGWFTVCSYFLAAMLAFRAFVNLPPTNPQRVQLRTFWLLTVLLTLCLGLNKQLDLQSLLTAVGKDYAHRQGWYGSRRIVQMLFIAMIFVLALMLVNWGLAYFGKILKQVRLAFAGIVFLLIFILLRASSFHHMDRLIGHRIFGLKMNWLLELAGIYCIIIDALRFLKAKAKDKVNQS